MLAPELLSYTASPGQGFHSTLTAGLRLDEPAPTCSAFVLYTLPPSIIVDRYELSDRGIDFELWGESNLELPVFAVSQTHTRLLVKVAARSDEVLVNLPVHARYGVPFTGDPMLQSIEIPPPATFWACPQSAEAYSSEPPVDAVLLQGYRHFVVSDTMSTHSHATLKIPLGSLHDLPYVEVGTVAVVLAAFLWLLHRSSVAASKLHTPHLKQQ